MGYLSIINIFIFSIMVIWGVRNVFINAVTVKNPFDRTLSISITGAQNLLLFTFITGIIMIYGFSAERLLAWIILFVVAIFIDKSFFKINFVGGLYVLFLLWLVYSITYSPYKAYGVRVFLKYIFPFLIMILASKVTNSGLFFYKAIKMILNLSLFAIFYLLILLQIYPVAVIGEYVFWNYPAILDFFPVAIAISLTYFSYTKQKKYLIYILLFILTNIYYANRTGLLAACITIAVFSLVRYRIKSLPYIIIAVGILIGSILYLPQLREKMFIKQLSVEEILEQREELSTEDIDSSGRFIMWEWSLSNFYTGKELHGSGLGVLQSVFYSGLHPFGAIRIIHNDYIQLLCDTGITGLVLYGSIMISLIFHSFFSFFKKKNGMVVRLAALIAGVSLMGMLSTLYTDNVVNYTLMTLTYPFGIYGMFLGLKRKYSS